MDANQRMYNALKRKNVDFWPVDIHFADHTALMQFANAYNMGTEEFYTHIGNDVRHIYIMDEVELYMQSPELLEYAYENGFARKHPENEDYCIDQWGVVWDTKADGQRPISGPFEKSWDGLENLNAPDPKREGQFYVYDKSIHEYEARGLALDLLQYFGPFEKGYLIRGFQNLLMEICDDENENIVYLLDKITDYRVLMAEEICNKKVTFGHSGDDYGMQNAPLIPLNIWRRLFKPRLERIWNVYKSHGLPIVHHSCGDCELYLDDMIEIGLDAIHPMQSSAMDIERVSRKYSGKLTFYGGFDTAGVLTDGTPEQVRENVEYTVKTLAKNGAMIVAPINVMRNVPLDNFKALVEAVHEFKYLV